MNYAKKMLIYALIQTSVGIILLLATIFVHFRDGFKEGVLSGIAGGLVSTGILGIFACLRLIKNPARAMEVEIAKDEERTLFLKAKANSATYSVTLYIESIGILVAGLADFRESSMTLAVLTLVQLVFNMGFAYYYGQKNINHLTKYNIKYYALAPKVSHGPVPTEVTVHKPTGLLFK